MANLTDAHGYLRFTPGNLKKCANELKDFIRVYSYDYYGVNDYTTKPEDIDKAIALKKGLKLNFIGTGRWSFIWFSSWPEGVEDVFFGTALKDEPGHELIQEKAKALLDKIKSEKMKLDLEFFDFDIATSNLYKANGFISVDESSGLLAFALKDIKQFDCTCRNLLACDYISREDLLNVNNPAKGKKARLIEDVSKEAGFPVKWSVIRRYVRKNMDSMVYFGGEYEFAVEDIAEYAKQQKGEKV